MKRDADIKASFTAADSVPVKLMLNDGVRTLSPVHIQWIPTNRCNLCCQFCSCSERSRNLEMDVDRAKKIISRFAELGTRAVTITGGGEPTMHPRLDEMIDRFVWHGISVGLVTNGATVHRMDHKVLNLLTWCRISHSDEREFTEEYAKRIEQAVASAPTVDWAFSYVVSPEPKLENIKSVVRFAEDNDFTHVRLVADLKDPSAVDLDRVRESVQKLDSRVIYQARTSPVPYARCVVGYVKPLIAPDFRIYHCCGVQYAFDPMPLDLPDDLCMGEDLEAIWGSPRKVWDVPCTRCYYTNYNEALIPLTREIVHEEFV